eukprot:CAMPEP_0177295316 /NCGR_PEP_ID=MMETSP0368-20130122/1795_1 /TAXON_ID=447022 ORGANISM="Scrippsiella hangoei-like, Strain SHHI-4" /NCGR_SAMPLE_ID=MMETSP0368 /ASSEMBLY_ACC=CAM_ASM_000363 /LENGTH=102 /DNA_ID=CAMNT_0018753309 /DNA_START=73 /DNA_END=381 /DNA_ORIENTATION=-
MSDNPLAWRLRSTARGDGVTQLSAKPRDRLLCACDLAVALSLLVFDIGQLRQWFNRATCKKPCMEGKQTARHRNAKMISMCIGRWSSCTWISCSVLEGSAEL